jgi:hypothetical protein
VKVLPSFTTLKDLECFDIQFMLCKCFGSFVSRNFSFDGDKFDILIPYTSFSFQVKYNYLIQLHSWLIIYWDHREINTPIHEWLWYNLTYIKVSNINLESQSFFAKVHSSNTRSWNEKQKLAQQALQRWHAWHQSLRLPLVVWTPSIVFSWASEANAAAVVVWIVENKKLEIPIPIKRY